MLTFLRFKVLFKCFQISMFFICLKISKKSWSRLQPRPATLKGRGYNRACATFLLVYARVPISSSNIMGDQRDNCSICFEGLDNVVSPIAGPFAAGRLLCWPCGHRVHIECMLQNQAPLRSIGAPCFLCKTPAYSGLALFKHF